MGETVKKVELLAPAGSFAALKAAIAAGANAVYLGGNRFGARAFSNNFNDEEMIEAIQFAHIYQVKVYVTLNTLIYDDEMLDVLHYIKFLYENDVDAVIIQDLGLLSRVRALYPDLELHASTQMSIHNRNGVKFLQEMGVKRVVLARENSITEIEKIIRETGMDIEIFVHGALCVCYSGQCLMSGLIGGRSGNRGRCAQPCRKKYRLAKNKELHLQEQYLISPRDLNTIEHVGDLIDAGVLSFKIEGRMKSPEYVAIVVSQYRKAIDQYLQSKSVQIAEHDHQELQQVFNRTYTKGFLFKDSGDEWINTKNNSHQGVHLGEVIHYQNNKVKVKLASELSKEDGIFFDHHFGMVVSKLIKGKQEVDEASINEMVTLDVKSPVKVGTKVFKTTDHKLQQKAELQVLNLIQSIEISMEVEFKLGKKPSLMIYDDQANIIHVELDILVESAQNVALTDQTIVKQLSKLKDTPYYTREILINKDENVFLPIGVLNQLRRDGIELLNQKRSNVYYRKANIQLNDDESNKYQLQNSLPEISVYVRSKEQLEVALERGIKTIYVDSFLAKEIPSYPNLFVSNPRINSRGQINLNNNTLIGNVGDLYLVKDTNINIHANTFLNVTNSDSIRFLIENNISRITLSHELNEQKLEQLQHKDYLELIVYGYQESMITKHCIFKSNCQDQCKKDSYSLIDVKNEEFPIYMDSTCHMHILNSKKLILKDELNRLREMGYKKFRLQFTVEDKEETNHVMDSYMNWLTTGELKEIDNVLNTHKLTNNYTRGFYNKEII
jgi:U32 family peptidase